MEIDSFVARWFALFFEKPVRAMKSVIPVEAVIIRDWIVNSPWLVVADLYP